MWISSWKKQFPFRVADPERSNIHITRKLLNLNPYRYSDYGTHPDPDPGVKVASFARKHEKTSKQCGISNLMIQNFLERLDTYPQPCLFLRIKYLLIRCRVNNIPTLKNSQRSTGNHSTFIRPKLTKILNISTQKSMSITTEERGP
jgi:hypothetical protein